VRQNFRREIRGGLYSFDLALSGEAALDVLRHGVPPEVVMVLSDINMPRMDGLTLLQRLEELALDLKTEVVSAYGDMRNIRTAMNRGAFDFITKPIEFGDLEATLTRTLEHLSMLRRLRDEKLAAERAAAALSRYFSPNMVETLSRQPECLTRAGSTKTASPTICSSRSCGSSISAGPGPARRQQPRLSDRGRWTDRGHATRHDAPPRTSGAEAPGPHQ
jgi:adenylate cyclase